MSDLILVLAMAAITYASRVTFLVRPRTVPDGFASRFLERFPLALFVAIAAIGLAAPEGELEVTIALVAGAGGVLGGLITRRSLLGIIGIGMAAWWLARLAT